MASRGRSLPALTKAWIAVSTSIGVLRLWAEASWDWSWCARQMLTCDAAVQRWLCRSSRQSVSCGLPMPGQQLVKSVDRRAPRDHPLEHIRQVGLRVEVIQLRRIDQTCQDRPGPGPALAAGEECILPAKCNRPGPDGDAPQRPWCARVEVLNTTRGRRPWVRLARLVWIWRRASSR